MSYTASQAQTGNQAVFAIKVSTAYVTIGEVTEFTQSGKINKTADVTNLESTAEEFLAVISNSGNYDLTMNRVESDAGQQAVATAFNAKATTLFNITLPKTAAQTTTGDVFAFAALVEELDDLSSVVSTKQIMTKAKLKVSGSITYTAGT